MTAGKYRHRIKFLKQVTKENRQDEFGEMQDEYGEAVGDWETVIECWSRVYFLAGRELWAAKQANSKVTGRVELRARADITADMRIKHGKHLLEIEAIIPHEEELYINFTELV